MNDIPKGFEELFGTFMNNGCSQDMNKPMIPYKGMTTEQLIKCARHNAELIERTVNK